MTSNTQSPIVIHTFTGSNQEDYTDVESSSNHNCSSSDHSRLEYTLSKQTDIHAITEMCGISSNQDKCILLNKSSGNTASSSEN